MAITPKQLAARVHTIGSSDAAAILAPSRWADEHKVRAQKLGIYPDDDAGDKALVGTLMEPVMRELLSRHLSRPVVAATSTFTHTKHPCLTANIDGFVDACKRGNVAAEFKVSGIADGWGEPGTDAVPLQVVVQVQHQMAVADLPGVHVARMFPDGRDWTPSYYYVPRDDAVIDGMVSALVEWFDRHVTRGEEIPLRDRVPLYDVQRAIIREPERTVTVAPDLFAAVWRAVEARKSAERAEEEAKARLYAAMGDAAAASCQYGTFVLKTENAGMKVPVDVLRSEFPDVWEKLAAPTTRLMPRFKLNDAGKAALSA